MRRPVLKRLLAFFFLFMILNVGFEAQAQQRAESGRDIIEDMVSRLRGLANVAEYEMTLERPKWTRDLRMKVWDDRRNKRVFLRILEPAKERDTAFLRLNYNLWNYLPVVERVLKIPPSMMLQPWMGSDFTNDDLVKESSYIDDYDHAIVASETRAGDKVTRIDLTPHPSAPVVWGKVIFWVRESDHLPVEQQFLDEKGTVVKDLRFEAFKPMDGRTMPTVWTMVPTGKAGQKTTLKLLSIDFDPSPPVPDSVFTERNLKP